MDDELIGQMGLILTQLRLTRRALEDIERSTSRYGGFAFASALSAGAGFGQPPMAAGALKVFVVNINDLTAGGGLGGFFEGLLGGVGRFFGGLFGGLVGGTIGGVALPVMVWKLEQIVGHIRAILASLGISGSAPPATPTSAASPAPQVPQPLGPTLADQLRDIRATVDTFTALFEAASSRSGAGAESAARRSSFPLTQGGERWLAMMQSAQGIIDGLTRVVNGLILLVPILLGSLVLLLSRLDVIKLAVLEVLQFIMRNVFLLRGVVLVTVFDTVAAAARLTAGLLGVVGNAVGAVLGSLFRMIGGVLQAAVAGFRFVGTGLQNTINALLPWLLDTLWVVLTNLGELRLFRVLVHVVNVLPAVLIPLYELLRETSSPALTPTQTRLLERAAGTPIPGPGAVPAGLPSAALPAFPNVADLIASEPAVAALEQAVETAATGLADELRGSFGSLETMLSRLGAQLDESARRESQIAGTPIADNLRLVERRSGELADALSQSTTAASQRPATGLETIAEAYERWLNGGGLNLVLDNITRQFRETPVADAGSLPGRVVGESADRPRASVDIQDVTIEIESAREPGIGPLPLAPPLPRRQPELADGRPMRLHILRQRGFQGDPEDLLYEDIA